MKKPHKHAELIKAWADGAEIEFQVPLSSDWRCIEPYETPAWNSNTNYRIKPEPKPDFIVYPETATSFEDGIKNQWFVKGKLKLTFDGETGVLKSAEVS